jgi:serine/threonine-protein kinase HipA
MIAYDFGVNDSDVFGLLAALGRDCAGALVVMPANEEPEAVGPSEPITDDDIAELIRKLRFSPLGVGGRLRVSLAGIQEKLLLTRIADTWALPVGGAPSTHILKPASRILEASIENEALCVAIARNLGLPVATTTIVEFSGVRVLAVERFDRRTAGDGTPTSRLHQEDFCQAHGVEPLRKYQGAGGPALRDCATTLVRWGQGRPDLVRLMELMAVNVLLGNADAHAKNLALLHSPEGRVELAPAYDLLSTTHYPLVDRTAGMFVNGVEDIEAITRGDLVAEAASWGLPRDLVEDRISGLLDRAPAAIDSASREIAPPGGLAESLLARSARLRG